MSMPPFPSYSHTSSTSSRLSTGGDNDDGIASTTSSHLPQYKDTTLPEPANVEPEHIEEDHQRALFRELYQRSEARIATLFSKDGTQAEEARELVDEAIAPASGSQEEAKSEGLTKKPARTIDEDDYDDDDDDDGENEEGAQSPKKIAVALLSPSKSGSSPPPPDPSPQSKATDKDKQDATIIAPKSSEDARRQLEEAKKATEDAVKRSLSSMFWLLDSDKLAMQEQQKLEESEKQIDAEMNRHPTSNPEQHGTLSSANLGASSLTLKHLIARIDLKRDQVLASDAELRSLMNEVRKNRSKWASEENVGQEELYEAAEKVLSELKAMTEYSAPFLTRVNKREAPDYYNIIKHPMDLGSMTKKLKGLQYKSKAEFVADLDLIWSNCLRYNQDLSHPLRRNANSMRKEAEKLVPLIPDIVVRPRAEVEAEERKKQNGNEDDGGDESDDEPIMSSMSRGRKAPGKTGGKGASKARKSVPGHDEGTPGVEQKPMLHLNGTIANLIHENSDVNMDGSQNGSATPPIGGTGSVTPGGFNVHGTGSHSDAMDIDGPSMNGVALGQALGAAAEELQEDEDYKIWKQVTKKDRAIVARERNKLFRGDKLNPDEPALLRTKAGMRRWVRQQKQAMADGLTGESRVDAAIRADKEPAQGAETLAEGMEAEEERVLPDYYDPLSAIPDIPERLQWVEDADGQVIDQSADFLRVVPKGYFTAPQSALSSRIEANMRQMQETRKICSKIGIVKQMQLQSQMYNNQFQKYNPEPFVEADIEPHITSDDGAIMSPWVVRAALQRSVGKICYHAGFEELQPTALDVITDLAADFFTKIVKTFNVYRETPRVKAIGAAAEAGASWQERFSNEEVMLHCLNENGLDIEALESYAKDDNERFGTKLAVVHERMKAHLADLLRPALVDAGADGAGAFNDGSEQFIGGDFAEDLDEDFFGFKELGLDKEFGLASLSVPLHLLQSKVHTNFQGNSANASTTSTMLFENLPPYPPVTVESLQNEIGLIKNFFLAKLHANRDEPLVEDEELPLKQRFPKPRLPPTGKITSPRKRPLKEQIGNAKKKKKLENGLAMDVGGNGVKVGPNGSPEKTNALTMSAKKIKLSLPAAGSAAMERMDSQMSQTEKDDGSAVGMMSPESIER